MRRWAAAVAAACMTAVTPAVARATYRGSDIFGNLSPGGTGGLADQYPLSNYGLDFHVAGPSLTGGTLGDVPNNIAQFLAAMLFQISTWLISIVLDIFDWAFNVDLINGPHGALNPIGQATQALYGSTVAPLLAAAIVLAGLWALHKGLVQRRFSDAASGMAVSVVLVVVALVLILKPAQTIGTAAGMTNDLSSAILAGATTGSTGNPSQAQTKAKDHLFEAFVYDPWVVMEFGGLKHCVSGETDKDGFPQPVPPNDPARRVCRDHLRSHNGFGGYAPLWLRYPVGSTERDTMYEAMDKGVQPADPCASSGKAIGDPTTGKVATAPRPCDPHFMAGWNVDKADAPAVDIQQAEGAFQRLALAMVVFGGVLGAVLLLGMLAFAALLAQLIALGLLAFAPAALLAALFPGVGHRIFRGWGMKLLTAVFIKAIYSLILAILIAVSLAMTAAVGDVSYLFAFGLQAAFFWAVFLKRKALAGMMLSHRETTRVERTTREAIATPVAAAAGVGWAGGVAAARRMRGGGDEEVPEEQQQHAPRPRTKQPGEPAQPEEQPRVPIPVPVPVGQAKPHSQSGNGEVDREVIDRAEPGRAGREELAPALAAAKEQEAQRSAETAAGKQPTIAQALEQARQEPVAQNDRRPEVAARGDSDAAATRPTRNVQDRPVAEPGQPKLERPESRLERPVRSDS